MQPADALSARGDAREADELLVARIGGDLLLLRVAERMAAGSGDPEAVVLGNPRDRAPELMQRLVRPPDRVADVRVQLDHRRGELGQASGPPVSAPASRAGNGCLRGSAAPRGQGPSRTITRKKMAAVRA